ncbi:hypothetical protein PV327_002796 [Microctonus hyperodae]|uniref:Uncharacterized protein n=1 Tax=Microctonus hyperodae TaxID=165561 RepID=A0AA39FGA6_MICHY|nr:hypothetical protein PV327_002796 [Microctonus hyperodae]
MPQGSVHWQGTERRACGPGAHWNVQVVRGKVTTRCLWHACKALGIGVLLMLLGACMATIGYYADQLSVAQEIRGNMTIKVKNESRGFHLNNLSYAGPIVMGVGGFIVVAACVMTFEARDSAAKVVPARFRFNQNSTLKYARHQRPRRSTSSQTTKWDHQLGLFRVSRLPSPNTSESSRRKQLTAEFIRFSKTIHDKQNPNPIKKSPSAPSLVMKKSPSKRKASKFVGCALLNPELLQRHALSVDNPQYSPPRVSRESLEQNKINGSQASMAMDLYLPNKGPVTLKVKDRSDTARRHQLLRQTKIDDLDDEEAKRIMTRRLKHSDSIACATLGAYSKSPTDFVQRKRASIDLKLTDEYGTTGLLTSPRDIRKSSSPNFRRMSFDKIGGERRSERLTGQRKSSFEFKRSPDFRRADCRYVLDEEEQRSRSNTCESIRKQRQKLYHSRSDDNRRPSFERHRRDSHQASRFSLNAPVVIEGCGPEYELKYFTTASLEKDESKSNVPDDNHGIDVRETQTNFCMTTISVEEHVDDALREEPELENLTSDPPLNSNHNDKGNLIEDKIDELIDKGEEESNEVVLDVDD